MVVIRKKSAGRARRVSGPSGPRTPPSQPGNINAAKIWKRLQQIEKDLYGKPSKPKPRSR